MAAEWTRVVMGDASPGAGGLVLGSSGDPSGPAVLTVPLIRGKEVIGAIECGPRSEGDYRDRDRDVLATLGRQAALAIQNAGLPVDLARQLSVRDEQARELAASRARIVDAQEAERRRIERDIHDGVQQQLISLVAAVRLARNRLASDPEAAAALLQETQGQALAAIADLRELVRGIHPPVLEDAGLVPAIEAVTGRMRLDVTLDVDGLRAVRFPARIETAAYFVVCEALTNVMKHAGVEEARVTVRRTAGRLTVTVSDQGVGFVGEPTGGSGLGGLRDRLVAVGGELEVISSPGAGSTVTAALPLDAGG